MTYQTESNWFSTVSRRNKLLILRTLSLLLLTGCGIHRVPQLLSQSETANVKPKIQAVLDRNAESLGEDVKAALPIQLVSYRQTNEILPYECWELSIANQNAHAVNLLWKIYGTLDDALAEQHNILNRIAKTDIPIAIPIVWDKALPYAKAPSVLLVRPTGMSLAAGIAWKVKEKRTIDGSEYNDLIKKLVALHSIPITDSVDHFPVGDWLRQMAEVGATRHEWNLETRDLLIQFANSYHPLRKAMIHGDYNSQSVWVDSTFTVTAITDWERLATGDPAVDIGYLIADANVIQPLEMSERYGVTLPENFFPNDRTNHDIVLAYCKAAKLEDTRQFAANVYTAQILRIVQTYLNGKQDPLLQRGMSRLLRYIPQAVEERVPGK